MKSFQPKKFPQNILCKILIYFMLLGTFMISAQTTFTESSATYNLNIGGNKEGGHAWGDYDLDGDFDLVINRNGGGYLMRNDGGSFSNQTTALAPDFNSGTLSRTALFADFNNDGYPDIFRNNYNDIRIYLQDPATNRFGNGTGGTAPNQQFTTLADGINIEGAGALDYDGDGDLDLFVDNHNFGTDILQNDGAGNFTHVTRKADSPNPPYNVADPTTWPLGLVQDATDGDYGSATDFNNDGWVDIVVRKNAQVDLFTNIGGTFQNGVDIDNSNNSNKGSVAFYDFDNDGDFDLYWTENGTNQIHRNNGDGTWTGLGAATGIPTSYSSAIEGLACGDVDNDGDIDIFLTGGGVSKLYLNQINNGGGAMSFVDSGLTFSNTTGHGCTFVDIDQDGDLDLYTNRNGSNRLFINNLAAPSQANHLYIDILEDRDTFGLTGSEERFGIGATAKILDCAGNVISGIREVNGGSGHGTKEPSVIHFGLPSGPSTPIVVEVAYPRTASGRVVVRAQLTPSDYFNGSINLLDVFPDSANEPPTAEDDFATVIENNPVTIDPLLDNGSGADSDPEGEPIAVISITQPANGTAVLNVDGTVTYTPDAGYFGNDTFTYTIEDNQNCTFTAEQDTGNITITVLVDSDDDGYEDIVDLDDDNDGILDTDELICVTNVEVNSPGYTTSTNLATGTSGTITDLAANGSNNMDVNYTLNGTATWAGGIQIRDDGGAVGSNTLYLQPRNTADGNGSATYEFVFNDPVTLQNMTFGGLDYQDRLIFEAFDNSGNSIILSGSNFTTGGSVSAVGNSYTYIGSLTSFTSANYVNEIVSVNIEQEVKRLVVTSGKADGSTGNNTIEVYNFSYCTLIDSDSDGLPNSIDLDSDGDGCYDANEAYYGIVTNPDSDNDGIYGSGTPSVDTSGRVIGASYTATNPYYLNGSISVCRDTDGDGVNDIVDLDDDNDGILDTVENPKTVLWVTQGTAEPEEQNVIDKLIALGYTVTVVDDNVGGNADNFAVTFLYEDVNSGTANANVTNMTTTENGVITSENALFDELLGTTGATGNTNTNLINITNNTHPITSHLSLGNYDIGDGAFYVNNIVSGTKLGYHPNGQANLAVWEPGDAMDTGIAPGRRTIVPHTNSNGGFNANGEDLLVSAILWTVGVDTDGDGIHDDLDLDSDGDGIPDNIEAQTTADYIAPSGTGSGITDANSNGLDDNYETAQGGTDVVPVNTDAAAATSDTILDYLDTDSDNDGLDDTVEAGYTVASTTNDSDNDGILDDYDEVVGFDVNDDINDPNPTTLQDTDVDVAVDGNNAIPLTNDLDYRDDSPLLPFVCDEKLYLSQYPTGNPATMYNLATTTNPFTVVAIGDDSHGITYNSLGFNPIDNFMYGIESGSNVLVKIAADGTTIALGPISGLPSVDYFSGEIDDNGNFYVMRSGSQTTLYNVNITTRVATNIALSQSVDMYDFAYNINNGLLYGINRAGAAATIGALATMDPTTGTVSFIGGSSSLINFGAMYGSSTGEIYGNYNLGGFYQFNTTTGVRTLISASPSASGNDGAHCVTAPITFSVDLTVTKTNGRTTYDPGIPHTTTYTIVVSNSGPFGVVNASVTDAVPTGILAANMSYTAVASSGSSTSVIGTQTGAINDTVSLVVGGTITYTVDLIVPATFTGNLENTITVINPPNSTDPNPLDNTETDIDTRANITSVITNRRITYRVKKN